MKKLLITITALFVFSGLSIFSNDKTTVESTSHVNWITRQFTSDITLDVKKAEIIMPSGKKTASARIKSKMPQLIQPPLLSLFADSNTTLSDMVISERITLDQVYSFIMHGYKTPDVFTSDSKYLKTTNTLNIGSLNKELVRHKYAAAPERPIEITASRPYSGIVIDARGAVPIHGEYIDSEIYPCFFPQIWDEDMNLIYERNNVDPEVVKNNGMLSFHYSDHIEDYEDRVGADPLYIKVTQVYGRNRTDPVIKHKDALKILAVPENVELLKKGKVTILLDKENLIYDVAAPEKDETYYVIYDEVKQYFYENKVPGLTITPTGDGILFSIKLKFYPDSDELLPDDKKLVQFVGDKIKEYLTLEGYTVLVEGHTADVGKPQGQLNLSVDRARAVMNALIEEGIEESLFSYKAYGGTMPVATNSTEEGRAQNRRVDITLRPRQTYILRDW